MADTPNVRQVFRVPRESEELFSVEINFEGDAAVMPWETWELWEEVASYWRRARAGKKQGPYLWTPSNLAALLDRALEETGGEDD